MVIEIREAEISDEAGTATLLTELEYPQTQGFIAAKIHGSTSTQMTGCWLRVKGHTYSDSFLCISFADGDGRELLSNQLFLCEKVKHEARGSGLLSKSGLDPSREKGAAIDRLEVHCHSTRETALRFFGRQGYAESPQYWSNY